MMFADDGSTMAFFRISARSPTDRFSKYRGRTLVVFWSSLMYSRRLASRAISFSRSG